MANINRVVLSGNLTREPENRSTSGGTTILNFGLAVNDYRKNAQTGEYEEVPNYIDCVMFGSRAESLSRILTKGMKVMIEGKLRWSQWEKDGQKRSKIEVVVDSLDFGGNRNTNSSEYGSSQGYSANQSYTAPSAPVVDTTSSVYDEDIPF